MKKNIKSQNIEVSTAIKTYIEIKTRSFERLIDKYIADEEDIKKNPIEERKKRVEAFWEVGTQSSGIKKGLFFCKVQIVIPGRVRHIKAKAASANLHAAIDKVKDIVTDQIIKINNKPNGIRRRAVRKVKREVKFDSASKDREKGGRVRDESA